MNRFSRLLPLAAVVIIATVVLGAPAAARADFQLRYRINGGAWNTQTDGGSTVDGITTYSLHATIGSLTIDATSSANTSIEATSSDLQVGGILLKNTTIEVETSLNSVLSVPPPQTLDWTMSHTTPGSSRSANIVTMEQWVSQSTTHFDTSGAAIDTGAKNLNTHPLTLTGSATASFAAPYQMILYTKVVNTNLTQNTNTITTDNNSALTPAPAPAGVWLLMSGAPVLGLAWGLRRRKAGPKPVLDSVA